jgi:hypothetical protein
MQVDIVCDLTTHCGHCDISSWASILYMMSRMMSTYGRLRLALSYNKRPTTFANVAICGIIHETKADTTLAVAMDCCLSKS